MQIKKGKDYSYQQIECFARINDIEEIEEHGPDILGQSLVVLDDGRKTYSFLLTGVQGSRYVYTCVFAE